MKKGNIIFALILLAAMICLLILTYQIPKPLNDFEMGAGYVPTVYIYTSIIVIISIIVRQFKIQDISIFDFDLKTLLHIALVVVYVIAIDKLGYYVSTLAILITFLLVLGEKRKTILLSVPVGFLLFIYVIFEQILNIRI